LNLTSLDHILWKLNRQPTSASISCQDMQFISQQHLQSITLNQSIMPTHLTFTYKHGFMRLFTPNSKFLSSNSYESFFQPITHI